MKYMPKESFEQTGEVDPIAKLRERGFEAATDETDPVVPDPFGNTDIFDTAALDAAVEKAIKPEVAES